jgi:hypothetical protein
MQLTALSGIDLPSSSELTTRCPTKLRMVKSDTVLCTITVQWRGNFDGMDGKAAAPAPYRKEIKLKVVTEEIAIAQKHILDTESVLLGAKQEVSQSIVDVYVADPKRTDLTLIDLPGFVRTVGKCSAHVCWGGTISAVVYFSALVKSVDR